MIGGGLGRDMPARHRDAGRDGRALQRQKNSSDAAGLGRQLQPPPGRQVEAWQLGHRRRHAGGAQRLLERPEPIGRALRPRQDQTAGGDALAREAGAERLQNSRDPDQRPLRPLRGRQTVREAQRQRRRRPRLATNMVKAGDRQAAPLEMPIDLRQPDRAQQGRAPAALQSAQPGAQSGDVRRGKHLGQNQNLAVSSLYVLVLLMFSVKRRPTPAMERTRNEIQFHLTFT